MNNPNKVGKIVALIFGIIILLIGVLFFIRTTHIVDIPVWQGFHLYWPLGLVLAGVAFLFGLRSAGWILMGLTAIVAVFVLIFPSVGECGEQRSFEQHLALDQGITAMNASFHFGAGNVIIDAGDTYLFENTISTTDKQDPKIVYTKQGSVASFTVERQKACIFGNHVNESWHIQLAKIPGDLYLGYGAATAKINISEIPLHSLHIDSGATDSEIIFGHSPVKTDISAGASNLLLRFPSDASVIIRVDAGASSMHLEGFEKRNETYVSPSFIEGNATEIRISAGASDVKSSFYEVNS